MKVGDKVVCTEGDLEGWTGVIVRLFNGEPKAVIVDLDQDQDPDFNLKGLLFECNELEIIK